ncbi:hypothetical protein EJK51_0200 [Moraxella catarrhalis]|nr:hypothetical protein EJK52_0201 [Moraxella catarrhalis]AZQ91898.1 hypothetical protein EJK51_0200 [Moraxella catarrhalis]
MKRSGWTWIFSRFCQNFWVQVYLDVPILGHRVSDTAVYAKANS